MWIFSSQSFISIVRHTDKPSTLIVRSRFRGHIEKMFPKAIVEEDANRDYRYRAELPVREVSKVMARMVSEIDYPNFKNSLSARDENYVNCCLDIYSVVAKNSGDWDFSKFDYLKEEPNEG